MIILNEVIIMSYVDYQASEDLQKKVLEFLSKAVGEGKGKTEAKMKKGINETTKAVERKPKPQLVVMAMDIQPPELAMHLPKICQEQTVPYVFVQSREELGKAVGIAVKCASLAIQNTPKELSGDLDFILKTIKELKK